MVTIPVSRNPFLIFYFFFERSVFDSLSVFYLLLWWVVFLPLFFNIIYALINAKAHASGIAVSGSCTSLDSFLPPQSRMRSRKCNCYLLCQKQNDEGSFLRLNGVPLTAADSVNSLGVWLDKQVSTVAQSEFFHLW